MSLDLDIYVATWMGVDTDRVRVHKAIANYRPEFSTYPADAVGAASNFLPRAPYSFDIA
jgi:hypothetical protein